MRELKQITRGAINWSTVSEHLVKQKLAGRGCERRRPVVACIPKPPVIYKVLEFPQVHFHRNCECNELVALNNRFLSPPLGVCKIQAARLLEFVEQITRKMSVKRMFPLSRTCFCDSATVPAKRKIYNRARENLELWGWQRIYARIKMFVKVEPIHGDSKDPRAIQGRTPEWTVELGRYIKVIEKHLAKVRWATLVEGAPRTKVWAKGLNQRQRAVLLRQKWDQFEDPVAFGSDMSRFDQSVQEVWILVSHMIYIALIKEGKKKLAMLLAEQFHNSGISSHGVLYYREDGRASGDPDTGCGNSTINTVGHVYYFSKLGIKYEFICDGDDAVIIVERKDAHKLDDYVDFWMGFGFDAKLEDYVSSFEQIKFCQTQPMEVMTGKWILCRDPIRVIQRSLHSHRKRSVKDMEEVMWSVGKCELSIHAGVPVLQEFAKWCIRNGARPKDRVFSEFTQTHHQYWHLPDFIGELPVSATARCSFERCFGISLPEQFALERAFANDNFRLEGVANVMPAKDTGAGPVIYPRLWEITER